MTSRRVKVKELLNFKKLKRHPFPRTAPKRQKDKKERRGVEKRGFLKHFCLAPNASSVIAVCKAAILN